MATTERLGIPLVEEEEQLEPNLWNRAFQQIDSVCSRYVIIADVTIKAGEKSEHIMIDPGIKICEVLPKNPENVNEWKAIMNANIRCYMDQIEGTMNLFFVVMGSLPEIDIHIHVVGWY